MASSLENYVFLAFCFGGPPLLLVALVVQLARAFGAGARERRAWREAAAAGGWREAGEPGARVRFAGETDGLAWVIERRWRRLPGRRRRVGPVVWEARVEHSPGVALVTQRPPALLAGAGGRLASALTSALVGALPVSDDVAAQFAALREYDPPAHPETFGPAVYFSAEDHPLRPASDALRALVERWPAREAGPLFVELRGDLLRVWHDPGGDLRAARPAELVQAGLAAHRALVSLRARPLR